MEAPDREDVLRRMDVDDEECVRVGIMPPCVTAVFEDEVDGVRRLVLTACW